MKIIKLGVNESDGVFSPLLDSNIPVDIVIKDGKYEISVPDDKYDKVMQMIENKSYTASQSEEDVLFSKRSNRSNYVIVRKIVFANGDAKNLNGYAKTLRTFLRRSNTLFETDRNNPNTIYVVAEVKDCQDYDVLKKQLIGFEFAYDLKDFGIISVSDINKYCIEEKDTFYEQEMEEIARSYLSRSLVYRALESNLYSNRQYILLDKYSPITEEKSNFYTYYKTDNKRFEKEIDLKIISDSDDNCFVYTGVFEADIRQANHYVPREIDTQDKGTITSVVRFASDDEVIIDTYVDGSRASITEREESYVTRKKANVFTGVPDESCIYSLSFREYFVRIKDSNYILHYSEDNDNFEIYSFKDKNDTMLSTINGRGIVCIYDCRDVDHDKFCENESRINSKHPIYDSAVKLFNSRKYPKKMVK